jgi:F-type H+-transporting ATPase subunit a
MTAGEVLLLMMAFLIPWILPVIFYGLETFIGIIQAFIFAGLTLVFATMAVIPHESEH